MITSAESYFNIKFTEGYNNELQCIRLNLDPVHAVHRPFIAYLGLYLITKIYDVVYLQMVAKFAPSACAIEAVTAPDVLWGGPFQRINTVVDSVLSAIFPVNNSSAAKSSKKALPSSSPSRVLSFWYRKALTAENNGLTPIVFIHGIGAGVICYTEFIHQISKLDRPVFLVEIPYVSMHMVDNVPSAAETVQEISSMLKSYSYDKAVYVGHSVGTAVCSWIMKLAPKTVGGMVLIDPICFLLHYHNVAFNFVYRIPKTLIEVCMHVMHYGAARELYISNYISRHFQWFEAIYFTQPNNTEEKPRLPSHLDETSPLSNATVFLSERDGLVCSAYVYQYLLERGVDAYIMKDLEHAMFLTNTNWKSTIKKQIDTIAHRADQHTSPTSDTAVTSLK
ncbi:hypothetical protein BDF20DRAFT_539528 [Mycotypha africana]|uniref:uncharacterized protein n=1 Tax=Mycotypha africana TaxID=64632 RepID=UPI0023009901|nr:uncharacterized protein BDF20DRAFT_539528 [Mycotypha africana]KAI8977022.1 hypothetical protein BDF20DRAFT_539528 [Mycotypha africana]